MNLGDGVNGSSETALEPLLLERNSLERQIENLQVRRDNLQNTLRRTEGFAKLAATLHAAEVQVQDEEARARKATEARRIAEDSLAKILESKETLERQRSDSDAAATLAVQTLQQTKLELEKLLKIQSAEKSKLDEIKRELTVLEPILIESRRPAGPIVETPFTELIRAHRSGIKKLDLLSEDRVSEILTPRRIRLAPAKDELTLSPSGDNWSTVIDSVHRRLAAKGLTVIEAERSPM